MISDEKVGMTPLEFPMEFGSAKGVAGGGEPGGGWSHSATGVLKL